MHIEEIIREIKLNPKKYIIEKNTEYLFNFLSGYIGLLNSLGKCTELDQIYHGYFNQWIKNWIQKNYDSTFESNQVLWHKTLSNIICDKKKAYNLFFIIIEDFFEAYHNGTLLN